MPLSLLPVSVIFTVGEQKTGWVVAVGAVGEDLSIDH